MISVPGEIFSFENNQYLPFGSVQISLVQVDKFEYSLCLSVTDGVFYSQELSDSLHVAFNQEDSSVEIVGRALNIKDNPFGAWGVKIVLTQSRLENFRDKYTLAHWETNAKIPYSSMNPSLAEEILDNARGVPTEKLSDLDLEDEIIIDLSDSDTESEEDQEGDDDDDDDEDSLAAPLSSSQNTFQNCDLAIGNVLNRTFVARGNKIGVFKITDSDHLVHQTSIVSEYKGSSNCLTPKKVN